jgi:methylated-DNA-[protein]-cysteine S-methyltransferase
MTYQTFFQTSYGIGLVAATASGVCRVELPSPDQLPDIATVYHSSALACRAAELLEHYFKGERIDFAQLPVDLHGLTSFQQQILSLAMQIPYGRVVSYGCLAQQAGYPGASRAVGGAMAANPIPIIVPCHRVVAASGALTGYSGPGGIVMKKNLLSLEGVEFRGKTATSKIDCFTQEVLIKK